MTARLASGVFASALIRRVNSAGGNATVVAKGDPTSGAILLICAERGQVMTVRERLLGPDGQYQWCDVTPQNTDKHQDLSGFLARRRGYDPDLWIIELDIANAERFAAEMSGDC